MFERRPLIAGNWKMNLSIKESIALIQGIAEGISDLEGVDVLVAPPFTSLAAVRQAIGEAKIFLAGQNMYHEMSGPYTGEVSGRMLQEAGCTHVIVGHSERRSLFHETDQDIDLKLKAAAVLGLIPIVCIGETLEQRKAGHTFDIIRQQLDESLSNFKADQMMLPSTILAYEPVWAIGKEKPPLRIRPRRFMPSSESGLKKLSTPVRRTRFASSTVAVQIPPILLTLWLSRILTGPWWGAPV